MKEGNEILAHNIRLLRGDETQAGFGERFGSNQKAIWAYEQGNSRPKPEVLLNLSRGFGISPEVLLNTRLKMDNSGKITNLPKQDKQVQALRRELDALTDAFEDSVQAFLAGIRSLHQRIDALEKQGKAK